MAAPSQTQKLPEDITNAISVKMDDHVHFKPNINLLSNKNQSGNSGVYSVLSGQSQQYNPPSLFSNNVRHANENLSAGGGGSLRIDERNNLTSSGGLRMDERSLSSGAYRTDDRNLTSSGYHCADERNLSSSGGYRTDGYHHADDRNLSNSGGYRTDDRNLSTGGGYRTDDRSMPSLSSGCLRIDERNHANASNMNYSLSDQDNSSNLSGAFTSTNQQAAPPQIFNASLNSANLLSAASGDQGHMISDNHEKSGDNRNSHSNQAAYNQGCIRADNLGLSNPIHLGISTAGGNNASSSSSSLHYSQSSSGLQYAPSSTTNQYPQSSSAIQYAQSSSGYQVSGGGNLVGLDGQHSSNNQQPTYVLLQAPNDGESGGQPQVFLAMQTAGIPGQDAQQQPYITLQPVSVDPAELSNNTMVQEGMSLQQAVMGSGDHVNSDGKQMTTEGGQQVVLSIPGQQTLLQSSSNNGQPSLVTYLQPLGGIGGNMEQGQVIMAASDLQGNLTLHNVSGISSGNKRSILATSRQSSQVGLTTPRRRLSTDPRTCDQCGRCFKYPSDLKKHLQIHTDIKKFQCDDCPRTFRRLHQLNVHRRIHTGEKPYVCNRCGAQFRHDSTLTMHIRTRHDHLKPFTCDGCAKKFGRMSHLRKHQRNVCGRSGMRGSLAQCKYCEESFPKKADLKSHFMSCEKKPDRIEKELISPTSFVCETCGKEFSRVYDFKRHHLSHSDEKPYGCPQCGKTFKERSSLNKHVKRMHCSEGDGTIPIDDDGIVGGEDDDEEELSGDDQENSAADIIVSLSMTGDSGTESTTATVTAQALAQAGIITSNDGKVITANGQTISAADILNFPEVAEALGINSGARATVVDSDGNSTMIAITQPGNLETSEVSMDMDQNIIQDGTIIVSENISSVEHFIPSSPGQVDSHSIDPSDDIHVVYHHENNESSIYNSSAMRVYTNSLDSSMVFKQEDDGQYIKHEHDFEDHVKAEQAAAHDLLPEDEQSKVNPSDVLQEDSTEESNMALDSV